MRVAECNQKESRIELAWREPAGRRPTPSASFAPRSGEVRGSRVISQRSRAAANGFTSTTGEASDRSLPAPSCGIGDHPGRAGTRAARSRTRARCRPRMLVREYDGVAMVHAATRSTVTASFAGGAGRSVRCDGEEREFSTPLPDLGIAFHMELGNSGKYGEDDTLGLGRS